MLNLKHSLIATLLAAVFLLAAEAGPQPFIKRQHQFAVVAFVDRTLAAVVFDNTYV